LFFVNNQVTNVTLLPDMTQLSSLGFLSNPLTSFVLPETIAATTNLTDELSALQAQGIPIYTYPLQVQLIRIRQPIGAFQFVITGPPGVYLVSGSADLINWNSLRSVNNPFGSIVFTDTEAHLSEHKFYRALMQGPPIFSSPNAP
jgi:hypothetical protein